MSSIYDHNPCDQVMGSFLPEILKYMQVLNPQSKIKNTFDISDERYFETIFLLRKIANIA